jgi:hypothetical protein
VQPFDRIRVDGDFGANDEGEFGHGRNGLAERPLPYREAFVTIPGRPDALS